MANLIVNAFTVPVSAPNGVAYDEAEIGGSRQRMLSGAMRTTVRAYKRMWHITTRLLTLTERTNLFNALRGPQPFACSGDILGGNVTCYVQVAGDGQQWTKGQIRYQVSFILFEQ